MSKEYSSEGVCTKGKKRIVYGVVTVTSKGQISIPADLRANLNIKEGDQLLVLRRRDDAGLILIKLDRMDELMSVLLEDGEFFARANLGEERGKGGDVMYTCKDCKWYKPIDESKGDCFGHVVPADMPADQCPKKAFEPRE